MHALLSGCLHPTVSQQRLLAANQIVGTVPGPPAGLRILKHGWCNASEIVDARYRALDLWPCRSPVKISPWPPTCPDLPSSAYHRALQPLHPPFHLPSSLLLRGNTRLRGPSSQESPCSVGKQLAYLDCKYLPFVAMQRTTWHDLPSCLGTY